MDTISGVLVSKLKIIKNPKGDVRHALKKSDLSFLDFGEAYFTFINKGETKGWKRHKKMVLNFIVPVGGIILYLYDDRQTSPTFSMKQTIILNSANYVRVTIPSMIWVAFEGLESNVNLLLNIANIEHDPDESENVDLNYFQIDK
jgi:dTDP-4-dehydrorhamnose 3,5-epimerase